MKKKKTSPPLFFRFVQWAFPKVEKISIKLAGRWFIQLFFTPVRLPMSKEDRLFLDRSNTFQIMCEGKKTSVYEWGKGKPILLVHGWMGRVSQFSEMVSGLSKCGYKVVSFDAPAHGNSEGRSTNLIEFSSVIQELTKIYGNFEMVVGHSLGGVAALLAVLETANTKKLAMISSPSIASEILDEFSKGINASDRVFPYLLDYVYKKLSVSFEELAASNQVRYLKNTHLLLIHDRQDKQVSVRNALALEKNYPAANLILTEGLGHNRILKDQKVIYEVTKFLLAPRTIIESEPEILTSDLSSKN